MTDTIIWHGRLTTKRRLHALGWLLAAAALTLLLLLLVIPSLVFVIIAFMQRGADGTIDWTFTFDNFRKIIFGDELGYLATLWRSIWIATVVTAACLALSYPLAVTSSRRTARRRRRREARPRRPPASGPRTGRPPRRSATRACRERTRRPGAVNNNSKRPLRLLYGWARNVARPIRIAEAIAAHIYALKRLTGRGATYALNGLAIRK